MSRMGLPLETISDNKVPARLMGYVSVKGKESVFGARTPRLNKNSRAYHAKKSDRTSVQSSMEEAGFTIVAESALGFSVEGPSAAYEDVTGGSLVTKEVLVEVDAEYSMYVTHVDVVGRGQPEWMGVGKPSSRSLKVDGIFIEKPRFCHAVFPSPIPPTSPKHHLRLPGDLALALNAVAAHQQGHRGNGVLVAMPDSGQFRHPFFTANGFDVRTTISVVSGANPSKDPVGHGTGESANIFAAAPGAELQAIRVSNNSGDLVGAIAGFLTAKSLTPKPRIITNSWGGNQQFPPVSPTPSPDELAWAAEIQDAVQNDVLVIFSAGNGQFSVEPQVPGVLAAGGVFMDSAGNLRASNYTSGFHSPWFGGVKVPTVSGFVGMLPRAQYLMLPVQPDCVLDQLESQTDPPSDLTTDGTLSNDGWALFSGTSAAAPQLAGVAALILGAKPALKPAQVIEAMRKTAVDVTAGSCHPRFNNPAISGTDLATGAGLVNAAAALDFALTHF